MEGTSQLPDRNWGRYSLVTTKLRKEVVHLLQQDPEQMPMSLIARRLRIGYTTVLKINRAEKIRLKNHVDVA